jgi:hypothetical protein
MSLAIFLFNYEFDAISPGSNPAALVPAPHDRRGPPMFPLDFRA